MNISKLVLYFTSSYKCKKTMYNIDYLNFDSTFFYHQDAKKIASHIIDQAIAQAPFYKIFSKLNAKKELEKYLPIAQNIRNNFSDLIIISMGGATLNPDAIMSLVDYKKTGPNIYFLNSTDPYFFKDIMDKVDVNRTAVLTISNSGSTLETIALCGSVIAELQNKNIVDFSKRLFFITDTTEGTLKSIAEKFNSTVIEHAPSISGRYSGLSNVALLPALISGLDIEQYIQGANNVIEDFYTNKENSLPFKSAVASYNLAKPIVVNIGYLKSFEVYLRWYSQIIAESLGKEQRGYTPIYGLGPDDQHSMLQLYLDGPRDKLFTLFYTQNIADNLASIKTIDISQMGYIANKNLKDIHFANFSATLNALKKLNLPVRSFVIKDLSAKSVGALMCHSMIEIVAISHLMQLNPFDQPGVELIKIESKKIVQG